jgi:hypothetical protein
MAEVNPLAKKYKSGNAASRYAAKLGVTGEMCLEWDGVDYESACIRATREGMNRATQLMLYKAREFAPKSRVHRITRRYPGGQKYSEPKHLWQALYSRVRMARNTNRFYGKVSSQYGYANMVIGYTKDQGGRSFLVRAREAVMPQVIEILGREWPKDTRRRRAI